MSKVSMDLVKILRQKTQVSLMDCKKALEDADGDLDAAVEILRKKGAAVAAKRADAETNNGRIEALVSNDFKRGSMVQISCETDFSANTEDMKNFALNVAQLSADSGIVNAEELMQKNKSLENTYNELLAKISEKIHISKIAHFATEGFGVVNHYIHPGSTIGVLIELATQSDAFPHLEELKTLARDICMHVAVMNPPFLNPESVDTASLDKEKEIIREQLKASGKPENMIDKIMGGKINKFYEESCLIKQRFIKNDDQTIEQLVEQLSKKINNPVTIKRFARFAIGR